mmetsp:Transcript_180/g.400  ORF Transcript_180/g.400 Transcript_180/m.400 type:complete len:201 (+) Transcript_180:523-1125(+)
MRQKGDRTHAALGTALSRPHAVVEQLRHFGLGAQRLQLPQCKLHYAVSVTRPFIRSSNPAVKKLDRGVAVDLVILSCVLVCCRIKRAQTELAFELRRRFLPLRGEAPAVATPGCVKRNQPQPVRFQNPSLEGGVVQFQRWSSRKACSASTVAFAAPACLATSPGRVFSRWASTAAALLSARGLAAAFGLSTSTSLSGELS